MGTETVSLREYIESQFASLKEKTESDRLAMEKRLEGMNEFRETLKDQTAKFITRDEFDAKFQGVEQVIQGIQKIVWVGIGATMALEFLLRFFIK